MVQPDSRLHIAHVVAATRAEGPGVRTAIWLQGCPLRCAGCCNPEMLPFEGGVVRSVDEALAFALAAKRDSGVEGITLLGGEPFAHAAAALLATRAQASGLTVMTFSGYELDYLRSGAIPWADELLAAIDILVDGPYRRDLPDSTRRWIGSTNQRIHFLSDRYRPDDEAWTKRDTLEIRWDGNELSVNGFPAEAAAPLWKRGALIRRHRAAPTSKPMATESQEKAP